MIAVMGQAFAQDRPNVVIMLADNVGYGDLGAYGAGKCAGSVSGSTQNSSSTPPATRRWPAAAATRAEGLGYPSIFNIERDPREEMSIAASSGWVIGPYLKLITEYQKSLEK